MIHRCNILLAYESKQDVVLKLDQILFNERRNEAALKRLTESLFSSGIKKLMSTGSREMKSPLLIIKNTGEIIEQSLDFSAEDKEGKFEILKIVNC